MIDKRKRNTGIEWTDETWNPIRGCSKVSAGCRNCYAETTAARFCSVDKNGRDEPYKGVITNGRWNGKIMFVPHKLDDPLRWQRPRMIFVNSMSDLFHENLDFEYIAAVFGVMAASQRHTFQVLTKRPQRALEFFAWLKTRTSPATGCLLPVDDCVSFAAAWSDHKNLRSLSIPTTWPLPNVWLGVSVEDQATADERIPVLLQCPAAVRWISAEPLLGSVDLSQVGGGRFGWGSVHALAGFCRVRANATCNGAEWETVPSSRLDWVVVGGESGHGARPMHPLWATDLRDQCVEAGVAFLFKQWGRWGMGGNTIPRGKDLFDLILNPTYRKPGTLHRTISNRDEVSHIAVFDGTAEWMYEFGKKNTGRLLDGRTWDEYPIRTDLYARQMGGQSS